MNAAPEALLVPSYLDLVIISSRASPTFLSNLTSSTLYPKSPAAHHKLMLAHMYAFVLVTAPSVLDSLTFSHSTQLKYGLQQSLP